MVVTKIVCVEPVFKNVKEFEGIFFVDFIGTS